MNMNPLKIEGIATFTGKSFRFDSGLPSNEHVIDKAMKLHGTMKVSQNANVEFADDGRVFLPPHLMNVCSGVNYKVKRSTRHYIIQVKVPVVEKRAVSEQKIRDIIPVVMDEITLDRKEILDV